MAGIMLGNRTLLSYSTDINNYYPTAVYTNIDNLGAFPEVKISSSNQTIETYDQEYLAVLRGDLKISNISIVVHYDPSNVGHQFLNSAYSTNKVFQLKFSIYESPTSLRQHFIILNGKITAQKDDADINKVYGRTWTYTPTSVVNQGSIDEPAPLLIGNYGLGADGTTVPHYEADPTGNAFIKVGATRTDNPLGVDLLGVGMVDAGGTNKAQIVLSESATPRMYIRNTDSTGWDQVYSTANKPSLAAGATQGVTGTLPISSGGTGATVASTALSNLGGMPKTGGAFTGGVTGTTLSLSSTLAVTGASTLTGAVTVNNTISQDGVAAATYGHTSLSSAAAGTKSYLRKMRGGTGDTIFHETVQAGNYRLATGATTDSSDALTLSSTGNLTITGGLNASSATLSTALPISSGGTGSTTAAAGLAALGGVPNTTKVNNKVLSADITLTPADIGTIPVLNGGTGATTAAAALTNLGAVSTSRTINGKPLTGNVVLAQADIAGTVSTSRTVNGQALSSNVDLSALDVSAMPYYGTIAAGISLNTLHGGVFGVYEQPVTANATTALGYPVAVGGTLFVLKSGVTHANSCTQVYYPSSSDDIYNRTGTSNSTGTVSFSAWVATANITSAGVNSSIKSLTGLTTALSVAQGGTGSNTQAGARTNLGLGTSSTYNTGTSGASVPLLNASNTWSGTQNLDSLTVGAAKTGSVGIELGSLTTAGSAFVDFHSSGFNNDYDTRIISSGGVEGSSNQGTLTLSASKLQFNGTPSFNTAIPITSGGTGSTSAAGALTSLGAASSTRKVNGYTLTSDITLNADDVGALPSRGIIPNNTDLNDLDGTVQGYYQQTLNANATAALNYPVQFAGTLVVLQNSATHVKSCTQMYYRYNTNDLYTRTGYSNGSGVISWGAWGMYVYTDINGANSTIKSLTGLTTPLVPQTRKVNNKALSADITLTASDVSAVPITTTINGLPLSSSIVLSQSDISGSASSGANSDITSLSGLTTALSIAQGGTGSTSASTALVALGGMPKSGGTFSGAVGVSSTLAVTGTLTTSNSLIQDGVAQTTYCQTALSSGTAGNKSYLRKFRGGSGNTIFHETVQGDNYRIASGTSDTTDAMTLSSTGDLTTSHLTATDNDATLPGTGSTVYGGRLKSLYTVNGVEKTSAYLQSIKRIEWDYSIARLFVNQTGGGTDTAQSRYFDFMSNGNVQISGRMFMGSPAVNSWWNSAQPHYAAYFADTAIDTPGNGAIAGISWGYQHGGGYNLRTMWGNVGNGTASWGNTAMTQFGDNGAKTRYWYFTPVQGDLVTSASGDGGFGGNYTYQKAATSDATLKHDIEYNDGKQSYDNIKKLKPCTFVYNFDPMERERRGIIAQDALRDIDSEYVKLVPAAPEYDDEGNRCDKDDTLALDNNVIMMDTALALNHSIAKIEAMANEIAELRAMIAALNK